MMLHHICDCIECRARSKSVWPLLLVAMGLGFCLGWVL